MFWITAPAPGRRATMPRPRGGDWLADDLAALRAAGVDTLVALITPAEAAELGLSAEAELARAAGLDFQPFPIPDLTTPPLDPATAAFIAGLRAARLGGPLRRRASVGVERRQRIP